MGHGHGRTGNLLWKERSIFGVKINKTRQKAKGRGNADQQYTLEGVWCTKTEKKRGDEPRDRHYSQMPGPPKKTLTPTGCQRSV